MSAESSSANFFAENLSLVGLSGEAVLFHVVKELVDNAIDACTSTSCVQFSQQAEKNVSVAIERNVNHSSLMNDLTIATVRDTGIGVSCDSVEHLGSIFSSTKKSAGVCGKFGIGFKMLLLNAHERNSGIKAKLRVSRDTLWSFNMSFNPEYGTSVSNLSEVHDTAWPWVTEFSIMVEHKQSNVDNILSYLIHHRLFHQEINISVNLYGETYDFNGICQNTFGKNLQNVIPQRKPLVVLEKALTIAEVRISSWMTVMKEPLSVSYDDESKGKLLLVRASNGMPLLPLGSPDCSIFTSLKDFLRAEGASYGIMAVSEDILCKERNEALKSLLPMCSEINIIKTSEEWSTLILWIDVTAPDISYGTINKSSVKLPKALCSPIVSCIHSLMRDAKKKFPNYFESCEDLEFQRAYNFYAPQLATSIRRIVQRSSIGFQHRISTLLEISPSFEESNETQEEYIGNAIEAKILDLLRSKFSSQPKSKKAKKTNVSKNKGIAEIDYDSIN